VPGSGPYADNEKCRDFVENLVQMREMRGWTQAELAAACCYSSGVISNIEGFQRAPLVDHARAIDGAFGLKNVFWDKAKAIQGVSFPEAFQDFPAHEAAAHDLYIYEHSVFPGLIQTDGYMRAVFATLPNMTAEGIDRLVADRVTRQGALSRVEPAPPRVWALVDEAALRRPVADAAVMYEQCMHALEVSRMPYVQLAVLPYSAGGHIGLSGACTIVERDGIPRVVNLDDLADGRVSEEPSILARVALRFRLLQHEALPSTVSRDMIARLGEELWTGTAPTGARALTALPTVGSA
jgi:transcriptional regulator with XRE-family HTH domain